MNTPSKVAQELHDFRLRSLTSTAPGPSGSPQRQVLTWVRSPVPTGVPLRASGRQHGLELRFPYYAKPLLWGLRDRPIIGGENWTIPWILRWQRGPS